MTRHLSIGWVRSAILSAGAVGLLQCSSVSSSRNAASPGGTTGSDKPSCEEIAAYEATEAYENAKPVFERFCSACHAMRGTGRNADATAHFAIDGPPFGGRHHAADLVMAIRKVLGQAGSPPTMPKDRPGVLQGDDLAAVLVWTEAYEIAGAQGCAKAPPPEKAHPEEREPEHGGGCH